MAKEALAIDAQGNDWALVVSMVQCHFHKNFSFFCVPWRARLASMYSAAGCETLTLRSICRLLARSTRFERNQNPRKLGTKRMLLRTSVPERPS